MFKNYLNLTAMQLLRQRPKPFVLNGGLLKLPLQCIYFILISAYIFLLGGKSRNQQFKTDGGSIRSFHKMCSMTASNINYGIIEQRKLYINQGIKLI